MMVNFDHPHSVFMAVTAQRRVFSFADFTLDLRARELRRNGIRLKLPGQPFAVLAMLVAHPGEVVTREELRAHLWQKETFVDFDHSLNVAINKLRETLCDSAEQPRFIETIPRTGYRFIGPVTEPAAEENGKEREEDSIGVAKKEETGTGTVLRRRRWVVVAAAVIAPALVLAGYLHFRRAPKLTDKDTIVLADFANTTGDPVFDDTLRQGLVVQLEQSPFLNLISDDRIQQVLKLMAKPADARLTPDVTREICERTASAAVLDGSIANLGSQYVLMLRAKDCRTGDILDEEQAQATKKKTF
jgi:DNA-binding winged helix-turn-helix (wHTH) protein